MSEEYNLSTAIIALSNVAICIVGATGFGLLNSIHQASGAELFPAWLTIGAAALFGVAAVLSLVGVLGVVKRVRFIVAFFAFQLFVEAGCIGAVAIYAHKNVVNWTVLCDNMCGEPIQPSCDVQQCGKALEIFELLSLLLASTVMFVWSISMATEFRKLGQSKRNGYVAM